MNFVTAHGYIESPTQRPYTAGLLSGIIATASAMLLMRATHTLAALSSSLDLSFAEIIAMNASFMLFAGLLYGIVFRRTANDRRGGWLFGLVYGFLLWLLGPNTLLQLWLRRPDLTGYPAIGLLCTKLLYGLVLGLVYPWIHLMVQHRLDDVFMSWYYSKHPREVNEHVAGRKTTILRRGQTH